MIGKAAALLALTLILAVPTAATRADFIYAGQAYAAFAPPVVNAPVAATGPLPSTGGTLMAHADTFNFMNVVTSGALDTKTMGVNGLASSDASVARFHADLRPLGIGFFADADLLTSHSEANGNVVPTSGLGSAAFTNLVVNGSPLGAAAAPNTMVSLGALGFVVLNEQTVMDAQVSETAVHVHLNGVADIFLAHTESAISSQAPVPEPSTLLLLGVAALLILGVHSLRLRF